MFKKSVIFLIFDSTGWGKTSGINPFPPNALQWAQIPIQTSENCQNLTKAFLPFKKGLRAAKGLPDQDQRSWKSFFVEVKCGKIQTIFD